MVSRFLTKSVPVAKQHSHGNTTYTKLKHIITTLATMGLILAPGSLLDNNGANASLIVSNELREWAE
jgi:ribose/xylose/arabinose/galactoside ABC-type transport system permease subunit